MASVPTAPEESEPTMLTARDMEQLSPNDRAQAVWESRLNSLDELDSDFRSRVDETTQRLLAEHGLAATIVGRSDAPPSTTEAH